MSPILKRSASGPAGADKEAKKSKVTPAKAAKEAKVTPAKAAKEAKVTPAKAAKEAKAPERASGREKKDVSYSVSTTPSAPPRAHMSWKPH